MKRREQALLFLRKAAQDESLLDAVLECDSVSDEVIGFHCQQAAEKILKALLSDLGITFHKTHELGALMDSLARSGAPLPDEFENLDVLTPFGAVYRYDDYDGTESLNRAETRWRRPAPHMPPDLRRCDTQRDRSTPTGTGRSGFEFPWGHHKSS